MNRIKAWLDARGWREYDLKVASADASFRRYFRLCRGDACYIVMDASKEVESLQPYLDVTRRLRDAEVHAPEVLDADERASYAILEDLGSAHYLDLLNDQNYRQLYRKAMAVIVRMQRADPSGLPPYDARFLRFEMDLMPEWFLQKYLGWNLGPDTREVIEAAYRSIVEVVLSQPCGLFVHRDYHSRNLMVPEGGDLGVIDFQDAMNGPVTYDLVSLLKDCYVAFPSQAVEKLALEFRDMADLQAGDATFLKWFDFMGMQRHLKVLGIFCRLFLRDGKPGYLNDLPLTLRYTLETAQKYEETKALAMLLQQVALPGVNRSPAR